MSETQKNIDNRVVIPFILGEETRPKIEKFGDNEYSVNIKQSIFYEQYCIALSGVAELVAYNNACDTDNDKVYSHSNIFIFTGERGSGKTSCMCTVRELLCNNSYKQLCYKDIALKSREDDGLKQLLMDTTFHNLETIDPIFFDNQRNILDMFMGNLFKSFQEYEYDKKTSNDTVSRNELLNSFSEAKRNLSILNQEKGLSVFDDLEQLCDLAASINFKKSLEKLVKDYIKYICDGKHQLILCIDDIDLNMSEGYELVDQIRKYLNIPGLIILMSVKIVQLSNVIRIKYYKDFSPLLTLKKQCNEEQKKYEEIIDEIVEKYISKLFPLSHRIQIPSVANLLNRNVEVFRHDNTRKQPVSIEVLEPLKDGIPRLIYRKTRQLIYNTTREISFIIPRNLRELLNLIHLLYSMKDARNHKEAMPNLLRYKDYFYDVWCTNNLDEDGLKFMRELFKIINADIINQIIIQFLKRRFPVLGGLKDKAGDKNRCIKELENIIDAENIVYNISLGDVLVCLDWLYKKSEKEKDLKLLFAIKTFYSIFLYEMFRNNDEIKEEEEKRKKSEEEIVNRAPLTNNATSYGDILNGNFFNSEYLDVAPYENGIVSRCRRIISNTYLQKLMGFVEGKLEKLDDIAADISREDANLKKIIDFFIFTTSFVISSKVYDENNTKPFLSYNYRKEQDIYYDKEITSSRKYVCFDILSIFYNLLDMEKTYKRYGISIDDKKECTLEHSLKETIKKRIEERHNKDEESQEELENRIKRAEANEVKLQAITNRSPLYKAILEKVNIGEKMNEEVPLYKKEKVLLYRLNLRNVELLDQISYSLQKNRPDGSSDSIALVKKIFDNLSVYTIKTYNHHDIGFEFFGAVSEFLKEVGSDDRYKEIFNKIYTETSKEQKQENG